MDPQATIPKAESENPQKIVKEAYNVIAPIYEDLVRNHPLKTRARYTEALALTLQPGSKVLELGCGPGVAAMPFAERGCELTGVDISEAQIALARKNIPSAVLMHTDMLSVDFPPSSFDAIVAMYSLLHLKKQEQEVMIGRIVKWLKIGGQFVCNFPGFGAGITTTWLGAKTYIESLGVEGNTRLLDEHGKGLRIIENEVILEAYDTTTSQLFGKSSERFHWIRAVKETEM